MVFQLLHPRTSTCPNKICIIRSHTLARLPRKISARLAHRGPSNRPRSPSTWAKNSENQFLTDTPIEKNSRERKKIFLKKIKSKTMLIHHVKGYPDPSMYSKNKGRITCYTNRETPCTVVSDEKFVSNQNFWDFQFGGKFGPPPNYWTQCQPSLTVLSGVGWGRIEPNLTIWG